MSNYSNSEKNGKFFILGFLIKRSYDRFFWKIFLDKHYPPSGQGKLTFNLREDTAPRGPAGRGKIKAFLHIYLRNELIEINVAKI